MRDGKLASRLRRVVGGGRRSGPRRVAFRPQSLVLEERRLPAPMVPIPQGNPRVALSTIFWNGEAQPLNPNGQANVPSPASVGAAKTITITNNSPSMIYPFLRGQNGGSDPHASPAAPYDPQDVVGHEFRQYIGYSGAGGRQFLGLPPGAMIKVQVPLALWDGDNLYIATDGTNLTSPSLFGYDPKASVSIAAAAPVSGTTWVQGSDDYPAGLQPLVMFYFSGGPPITLPNDAPAQLTEVTFRDQYLEQFINDPNQTFPLINYDVSYVNNMVAPVAMEASQVPITYQVDAPPAPPKYYGYADFGWLATNRGTAAFEGAISNFTNNVGSATLGQYFGGRGWPQYYDPNPANDNIPSGANLFANSPLTAHGGLVHTSTYNPNRWLLTSSGNAPIQAGGGGYGQQGFTNARFPNRIGLGNPSRKFLSDLQAMLKAGPVTVANASDPGTPLGTVTALRPNYGGRPFVTVNGSVPPSGPSGQVYLFTRTASDYATTAITNLWYSWAQYYVQQFRGPAPSPVQASVNLVDGHATNRITVAPGTMPAGLAVGMTVTAAAGLPAGTTVLKIVNDDIYLSRIPADDSPATQAYSFGNPQPIAYDPQYTSPYALRFSSDATPNAVRFAGSVYEAMAVQAGVDPLPQPYLPYSMGLVAQVIQFYAKIPDYDRPGDTGSDLVGQVRDVVKSILRGVYDYIAVADQTQWYPNPARPPVGLLSGQNFNVFNLDPYVWFVHDVQGMSAYGFSVDDDVSNPTAVGPRTKADGPNHAPNDLQIAFGGLGAPNSGIRNKSQWFPTIPWGSLSTTATLGFFQGDASNPYNGAPVVTFVGTSSDDALTIYNQINNPGDGQVGATISVPGFLPPGTQLVHKGPQSGLIPQIILKLPRGTTLTPSSTPVPVTITAQP